MTFTADYRVRYAECDQQGVVFNAWYQTYMDDAFDCWLRELDPAFEENRGWEVMVKAANIVWDTAARFADTLTLALDIGRWGTTSFDLAVVGAVGDRHVFDATMTYVVVDHVAHRAMPIPDELRAHLAR